MPLRIAAIKYHAGEGVLVERIEHSDMVPAALKAISFEEADGNPRGYVVNNLLEWSAWVTANMLCPTGVFERKDTM